MPTHRQNLELSGHPFFYHMYLLRQVFDGFEHTDEQRGGTLQDATVKMRNRIAKDNVGEYEPELLVEDGIENVYVGLMHRLCQIVLLYSTFECLCKGTLGGKQTWSINESLIRRAKKRARGSKKQPRENFVLATLDAAERGGMESGIWPTRKPYIEAFVILRNHFIHEGLEVSDSLRNDLQPVLPVMNEFPGSTLEQKLEMLGRVGSLVHVPKSYVATLFHTLDELARSLIVPVDGEEPDIDA